MAYFAELVFLLAAVTVTHAQVINTRGCRVDLCFVMDESGSITSINWKIMTEFVGDFVDLLYISPTATQVGVVKFSSGASLSIPLNRYGTTEALRDAIYALPYGGGLTSIHRGLQVARQQCFSTANGGRTDAPKILVLMTDGHSCEDCAKDEAVLVKAEGISIISIGIGSGFVEDLLMTIADDPDNFYSFENFDLLLEDVSLILGRSCLRATDCAGGQITQIRENGSYPVPADCPDLKNPVLKDRLAMIEFMCQLTYNDTDPDARYKVTFLFDGEVDSLVPDKILTPPDNSYILHEKYLHRRLNKYLSCQVESFFSTSPSLISPPIVSRSYWLGIAPSQRAVNLFESSDEPADLWFYSTLPIKCTGSAFTTCVMTLQVKTEDSDQVAMYQPTKQSNFTDVRVCEYILFHRDWDANLSLAYNPLAPLQLLPKKDPMQSPPRKVSLTVTTLDLGMIVTGSESYEHPFNDYEMDTVKLFLHDAQQGICRSRGDPWMLTFDGGIYGAMQQGYFIYVKSTSIRNLEIQARHFPCTEGSSSSGCSIACGVAVREGKYAMGVDRCNPDGTFHALTFNAAGLPQTGTTFPSGQAGMRITTDAARTSFMIQSDAGVRVNVIGNSFFGRGLDIEITLPARDYKQTSGLCGTFDSDQSNDYTVPDGTLASDVNDFITKWMIPEASSLFSGFIPDSDPGNTTENIEEKFCSCYNDTRNQFPVPGDNCGLTALEDPTADIINPGEYVRAQIPWFIWQNIRSRRRRKRQTSGSPPEEKLITDDIDDSYELGLYPEDRTGLNIPPWGTHNVTERQAEEACMKAVNSSALFSTCNDLSSEVMDNIIIPCKTDIQITGDLMWASSRGIEFRRTCVQERIMQPVMTERNSSQFEELLNSITMISMALCPSDCRGNGLCEDGKCKCGAGYMGADCSVKAGTVPQISKYLTPSVCDVQERFCHAVKLLVSNVVNSDKLTCQITITKVSDGTTTTFTTAGTLLTATTVECPLPDLKNLTEGPAIDKASLVYTYSVSLSNDAVAFSFPAPAQVVTDSECLSCDVNATCIPKINSCLIDGRCYSQGEELDECYICDPTVNSLDKTIIPGDPPKYASKLIYRKTEKHDLTITLSATDPSDGNISFSLLTTTTYVTLTPGGILQWLPDSPTIQITVHIISISSGCPFYTDVNITLESLACGDLCSKYANCDPDPGSEPGSGEYTCTCSVEDMCTSFSCKNGASCTPGDCDFTCTCTDNYNGTFCENRIPDIGAWSEWSEFTECTKSCDYETKRRTRLCLRSPCEGSTEQILLCNSVSCPESPEEKDEGVTIVFPKGDIIKVSEDKDDIREHVTVVLNDYCVENTEKCCTAVQLRTVEEPQEADMFFMPSDIRVASGFPRRADGNIQLKLLAEVDIRDLEKVCVMPAETDDTTRRRRALHVTSKKLDRERRQVNYIRIVDASLLEDAVAENTDTFLQEFGTPVTIYSGDDEAFTDNIVIPAASVGAIVAVIAIVIIIIAIRKRSKNGDEDYQKQRASWGSDTSINPSYGRPPHISQGSGYAPSVFRAPSQNSSHSGYNWRPQTNTRAYDNSSFWGGPESHSEFSSSYWNMPWKYYGARK